jgi:voltage-gated potassium channel
VPAPSRFLRLPDRRLITSPTAAIAVRLGIVVAIVLVNWAIVAIESDSYTDSYDGTVSITDALYYTTVTLTTTGYGDITPVTTGARMVNALVVTPMRLLFVVLLVGTTIKALTRQSRDEFRAARWRKRMTGHTIVLGYGTKGRNAARALQLMGTPADHIVVVDPAQPAVTAATEAGHTAVHGSGLDEAMLRTALLDRARAVIIALNRDDSAVLATLTVRRLNPRATIIAAARESQNAQQLRESGANSVIVSSETTGRLLGIASGRPQTVEVVEDLLSFGHGLDLRQRPVSADEVGRDPSALPVAVLAVVREGALLHYDADAAAPLADGDELIYAAT